MIRTLVIEDEPAVRQEIEWLVQKQPKLNLIGVATNVRDEKIKD